jgi:hypothetical protein
MAGKNIQKARFTLTGITPLLMHADNVEAASTLDVWRKDSKNKNMSVKGDDRSPPWTWQTYVYIDDEGLIAMPADNLMVAIRQAGAKMILKGQKTFKEITQSGLLIARDNLEFINADRQIEMADFVANRDADFVTHKKMAAVAGFGLDVRRAKVGPAKHVRVRPIFRSWKVSGEIQILADEITLDRLSELFEIAGSVGLGDWRPGCKTPGSYGQFEAKVSKV